MSVTKSAVWFVSTLILASHTVLSRVPDDDLISRWREEALSLVETNIIPMACSESLNTRNAIFAAKLIKCQLQWVSPHIKSEWSFN